MKKIKDERITKEFDKMASKTYWYIFTALLGLLIYKMVHQMELVTYALELLCFIFTLPYLLFNLLSKRLLFIAKADHSLLDIRNKLYGTCFMICFWIIIIGEFLLIFIIPSQIYIVALYLAVWMPPSLLLTVYSIKKGLLLWGGEKRKQIGTAALKKRVVIGALFFGLISGFPMIYDERGFHITGILWMLGTASLWGIPFYLVFHAMIKRSEKNADRQVLTAEIEEDSFYEKQKNENSQN